jgi:hypothetical protein
MKTSWTTVVLTATLAASGCGDRTPENAQNIEQTVPGASVDPSVQSGNQLAVEPSSGGATVHHQNDSAVIERNARPPAAPAPAPAPAAARETGSRPAATAGTNAAPAVRWREVTLPAGTALPLELTTAVSTETAKVETPVRARVRNAVESDGYVVIPAGTILTGSVIDVERPGRVQGRARLALRFTEAEIGGVREDIRTNPISFEGEATKGEDATKIGAGAVGGAIIGGILGGGDGAAKGAAIGGAAGTGAVLATRGRDVSLGAGHNLNATLASPVTVRAETR